MSGTGSGRPDDPVIVDSLRVLDAVLKVDTPNGPCWRRYNHDGYGQREDGGPFVGYGKGRAWPLLTGERGHYELAAGRAPGPYLRAMEGFASPTGLLPEQVWDEPDRPDLFMFLGRPTGSARPLMWAHAEYIKLLRSAADGKVFDLVPEVADRYLSGRRGCKPMEIWKHNRQVSAVRQGFILRIQAGAPFLLHWTRDDWGTAEDSRSTPTSLGIEYLDIAILPEPGGRIRFTFFWTDAGRWEGKDFEVAVVGRERNPQAGDNPQIDRSSRHLPIALFLLFPPANANHEEDRGEENRDPRVLSGGQPEVPGIADAQEIQEEAGRDVEEQEGDQEEPRRAGLPVQRKEGGDHQARHVEEFVPSQIMERHLRQGPRAAAVPPAGRPPGRRKRCRPVPPGISG